jgi:hypothetical protein
MRATMYFLSVLAQDEDTQRQGCVMILFNMDPFRRPMDPADSVHLTNLNNNLGPIRFVGYHFCYDEPQPAMISNLETALSSSHQSSRVRFRVHSGTSTKELDLGFTWFASISILTFSSMLFCRFITGNPLQTNDLWNPDQGTASDSSRRSGLAASSS